MAHTTTGAVPRDPCVFWHDPTQQWILAIYELENKQRGTGFYGSSDLINWKKLSYIQFGYECPDVYELPLDGSKQNKKWVLQDASGS